MADKKDPTVSTRRGEAPEYPEGTHPVAPIKEQAYSPDRFKYSDHPDKPDPSTVAQIVEEK